MTSTPTKKRPRKFFAWIMAAVPLVLVGGLSWLTYRDISQQWLDEAIIDAVKRKDVIAVGGYLQEGANPNAQELTGKHESFLKSLLEKLIHRSPSAERKRGRTALVAAVRNRDLQTVAVLLHHGASPNFRIPKELLPLDIAMLNYFHSPQDLKSLEGVVRLLMQHGARAELVSHHSTTPPMRAMLLGMPQEFVDYLNKQDPL